MPDDAPAKAPPKLSSRERKELRRRENSVQITEEFLLEKSLKTLFFVTNYAQLLSDLLLGQPDSIGITNQVRGCGHLFKLRFSQEKMNTSFVSLKQKLNQRSDQKFDYEDNAAERFEAEKKDFFRTTATLLDSVNSLANNLGELARVATNKTAAYGHLFIERVKALNQQIEIIQASEYLRPFKRARRDWRSLEW